MLIADGRAVLAPTTSPTWLSDALTALQRDGVAAVGGEVRDRSGRWLQAGLRPDLGPLSGLLFDPAVRPPLADATCNPLAVCAAPMLVSRSIWEALGGFDEDRFPDALFDVDLALRATRRGLRNVYIPSLTVRVPVVRTAPEAEIARFIRTWLSELSLIASYDSASLESADDSRIDARILPQPVLHPDGHVEPARRSIRVGV